MADQKTQDPPQDAEGESEGRYRHTREAFHELPLEKQARFLVEATASTMARGIEAAARSVADEMEEAFRAAESAADDPAADTAAADTPSSEASPADAPDANAGPATDPADAPNAPTDPPTA